jgi:NTE family protein
MDSIFKNNNDINKTIENEINKICNKNNNLKDTLIFSGGGIKGFVFIGAVKYLEEINILKNITTYIGTSIGAYFSILLIIGYTSDEIYKFIKMFDFTQSININIQQIFENYALDNSENFVLIFKKLLEGKKIDPSITLLELYRKTKKKIIMATVCITTKKIEYISYENYPDLLLVDAIRMTTSIPLIFPPVKYNDYLYIDGGLLDNFPIKCVEDDLNKVIGIYIHTNYLNINQIQNIKDYIINLFDLFLLIISKTYNEEKYKNIVYNISIPKINPVGFSISNEEKKELYKLGYNFMKKNFKL